MKIFIYFAFFILLSACSFDNFISLSSNVLVPGETKLNKADKAFAVSEVFSIVKYFDHKCTSYRDYKVINTKVDYYGQWKYGPSWDETWIVEACNTRWSIPIHFGADGAGHTNVMINANLLKQIK